MKVIICIILIAMVLSGVSQDLTGYSKKLTVQFEQSRQLFENQKYRSALEAIQKLIKKEPEFLEAFLLKADVLHEMDSLQQEIICLEHALKLDSVKYPKANFTLGSVCMQLGEYAKGKQAFLSFVAKAGSRSAMIEKARTNILNCDFALQEIAHAVYFEPVDMGDAINTALDEYWPSLSLDEKTLVFTRLIPFSDTLSGRTFMQEDFFVSTFEKGKWSVSEAISAVNTLNNEGAQAISPDASLLFFTACSRRDTWGGCDLYFSRATAGGWSEPRNVGAPVNSSAWESQPSVSDNNEFLYFVSSRKGGKGGMDIWRCRLLGFQGDTPQWGKAENLGDSINTPGNEMSPFMHPDGETLYFSSNYWQGMGGNDIFISKMKADSSWSHPVNLGYPINTHRDEQGLVVDASGRKAYYSTNRSGNGMDLFWFEMPVKTRPKSVTYIRGNIFDSENHAVLPAHVELIELFGSNKKMRVQANENGEFLIGIPMGQQYLMNVSQSGYLFYSENFKLDGLNQSFDPFLLDIPLKPIKTGSVAILRNVFFETDSYQLMSESKSELTKLIQFLKENPRVKIEIGGHTDNEGSELYNQQLSEKRAREVLLFLSVNGIEELRLRSRGYGFSKPINTNDTEVGRAENRRTEFEIIEMSGN